MTKEPKMPTGKSWNGYSINKKHEVPKGLWQKCPSCEEMIFTKTIRENLDVCPGCEYHFRIGARRRIDLLCDEGSFEEMLSSYVTDDPLNFTDSIPYKDRIDSYQKKSDENDACIIGKGYIQGRQTVIGALDPTFMMGSMGSVVGEKVTVAIESATELQLPLIFVSCSGGARMQEGVLSLSQMAKTSAALARLDDAGGLFISILADPTYGGVTASFAMLGDIHVAEPQARIGFAGPRVVWDTVKVALPEGFQTAEFLLEKGFIDRIVSRKDLRTELARLIDYCPTKKK